MKQLFLTLPRAKIEVQRVPGFKEATSPGAYYEIPAMDGTPPGSFFANLRDMNEVPKWSMPTLAYHEGVPGHHWQISTAQELKGVPQFRKCFRSRRIRKAGRFTRMAGETGRVVRRRSVRRPRTFAGRAFPRGAARGRYGHSCETLDARTGDRLHAREDRHGGERSDLRDRALHRGAGAGVRLQGRDVKDCRNCARVRRRSWERNSISASFTMSC